MNNQRAIIAGGGIGGLATALAFEKIGLDYIVLEQASEIKEIGSGITIWSNGLNCLKELGLEQPFKTKAYHADHLFIHTQQGKTLAHISFKDFEERFGSVASTIHRADLINILVKSIPSKKILLNRKVESFLLGSKGVSVQLTSGERLNGTLLIGADGIHSVIRKQLGDNRELKYSGYTCWRGLITANPSICVPKPGVFVSVPKSIFGLAWLKDNKWYWFVGKTSPYKPTSDLELDSLKQNFSKWPQYVQEVINHTPADSIIRNDIMYLTPKKIWGKGLCTLLGDAAHPMTPDLAQGASIALEDAVELAHFLLKTSNPEKALRLYEKKRYVRTKKVVKESHFIGLLSQLNHPFLIKVRDCFYSFKIGSNSMGSLMFKSIFRKYAKYRPPALTKSIS